MQNQRVGQRSKIRRVLYRFGKHINEPVWRPKYQWFGRSIPTDIADWVFDSSSLTRRVILHCNGQFQVQLINQAWARPMLNEAMRLGLRTDQLALIRQVFLLCNKQALIYARTVIPASTLTGAERYLANLGTKPLGAVLFSNPTTRRGAVEVACIQNGQHIFNNATYMLTTKPKSIWGRRSIFYLSGKPLLVNEVYLPKIFKKAHTNCK